VRVAPATQSDPARRQQLQSLDPALVSFIVQDIYEDWFWKRPIDSNEATRMESQWSPPTTPNERPSQHPAAKSRVDAPADGSAERGRRRGVGVARLGEMFARSEHAVRDQARPDRPPSPGATGALNVVPRLAQLELVGGTLDEDGIRELEVTPDPAPRSTRSCAPSGHERIRKPHL
jgi:hypothetical protein